MCEGGDEYGTVDVGSDYMRRFRQVACSADYVVVSRYYSLDEGYAVGAWFGKLNLIAYSYGVGCADAFYAEIAFGETFYLFLIGSAGNIV